MILSASSNTTVADVDTELIIETDESWDDGDYQLVHFAMGSSSNQVQAGTDTVSLKSDTVAAVAAVAAVSPHHRVMATALNRQP